MNNSISLRFNLVTSIMVAFLLISFGVFNYLETEASLHTNLDKKTNGVMNRLIESLPATLWNYETQLLTKIVHSEIGADEIKGVFIFDSDNKLVLGRIIDKSGNIVDSQAPKINVVKKEGLLSFDNSGKEVAIGRALILVDSSSMDQLLYESMIRTIIQIIVMVFLLIMIITSLSKRLHDSAEGLKVLTNSVNGVIWEADPKTQKYTYISDQVETILGYKSTHYLSGKLTLGEEPAPEGVTPVKEILKANFEGEKDFTLEYQVYGKDQEIVWIRNIVSKNFKNDSLIKIRGIFFDITEEKILEEQRTLMEGQLKHAQKMEAIGQLAAGIAHEINTPSQFVGNNLIFIDDSIKSFSRYFNKLETLIMDLNKSELTQQLNNEKEELDIEFLSDELPQAIAQSIDGVARVSKIVSAMKDFSHPGKEDKQKVDINHAIESTTIVAGNEWKYLADLELEFAEDLSMVNCFPGEVNQVVLNMIVNACHAIEDVTNGKEKGCITITTLQEGSNVVIKIRDTGAGIEPEVAQRVFDPFFTTKEVGKGTGQGLSLAYSIIVEKHGGKVSVDSTPGIGTTFTIELPI